MTTFTLIPASGRSCVQRGARLTELSRLTTPRFFAYLMIAEAAPELGAGALEVSRRFYAECIAPKLDRARLEFTVEGIRIWLASQRRKESQAA